MCDPVSIGTAALMALTTVTEHIGTNQAAAATEQAANIDFARESDALARDQVSLDQEKSEKAFDTAITAARSKGDIFTFGADTGASSTSLAQQLNASMFGIGREATADDINDTNARVEIANRRGDAQVRRQSRINSAPRSSTLSLLIGLGTAGVQGASMNAKRPSNKEGEG